METGNWYIEYAVGDISNRMQICKLSDFPKVIQGNLGKEIYRSMFLYSPDIVDYVIKTNTVSDYKGVQSIDKIVLDIDLAGENSGDKTRLDVLALVRLMKAKSIPEDYLQLWFSGRGFHIHTPNIYGFKKGLDIAKQVKATLARDYGRFIDLIYDPRRLIRAGYSFNKKTQCYKIPISHTELKEWSYEQIKNTAKTVREDYQHLPFILTNNGYVKGLDVMDISRKNTTEHHKVFEKAKGQTSRYITCAQHLYNEGEIAGMRHKNFLRLVSIWISKYGFNKQACDSLAKTYFKLMDNPLPADEVSRLVANAYKAGGYKYGCGDEVLKEYCDSKCVLFKYKNLDEETEVLSADDMTQKLLTYVGTDFSDKSFNLKNIFNFMPNDYTFKGGELAVLIGDTKLGKTAFWQYVITQLTQIKTLFLSLEVDDITMIRRFFQIGLQKTKEEINTAWINKDQKIISAGTKCINHIKMLTSSPDVTEYSELIAEHEPKILVIDTIDRVPARYATKDDYQRQEYVINQLKDLAMKEEIIILAVSHISKGASNSLSEGRRLTVHSAKGNSAIEQKADKIIGFEGNSESNKRKITAVASRDESNFEIITNFDWKTFTFTKRT